MGRNATRNEGTSGYLTVYANPKLKQAIRLAAAENGEKAPKYVFDILSNHPEIKKAMKKIS